MLIILGREMSTSFQEYYEACLANTGISPEWAASREVPYGQISWHRPEGERSPMILLNPHRLHHVFEHTAAHELGHIVQFCEGYPHLGRLRVQGDSVLSKALGAIGKLVAAVVVDPDTERRLKPYGLWASDRFDATFENIEMQLPEVTRERDEPGKDIYFRNALQYAYAKVMLSDAQWQTAEESFQRYLPNASRLGERIYRRLPAGACDTVLKARQAYQSVVLEIGLGQYFLTWSMPEGKQ
jgi:hypothetical protein